MADGLPPAGDWSVTLGVSVVVQGPNGAGATPRARKARALIAYLGCKPGRSATRAEVAGMLWSDRARTQAFASLRQCLFELRTEAPGLVGVDDERIWLTDCKVDDGAAGDGRAWLSDLNHIDPAFDGWLAGRRPVGVLEVARPAAVLGGSTRQPHDIARLTVVAAALALALLGVWFALRARPFAAAPKAQVAILAPWSVIPRDFSMQAEAERIVTAIRAGAPSARLIVRATGASADQAAGPRVEDADWLVSGAVLSKPQPTALSVQIQTPRGVLLWSKRIEVGADGLGPAGDRLAAKTAGVLLCAVGGPRGIKRGDDVTALLMDTCGRAGGGDTDEVNIASARRLVAAAPGDAYAHGLLSATLGLSAPEAPATLQTALRAEARAEATRALALDPKTGEAYLSLGGMALDRRDFAEAEAQIKRGLAAEPDHPSLPDFMADVLAAVGRSEEALVFTRRALALDPVSMVKVGDVADGLARVGQIRAALALIDQTERQFGPSAILEGRRVSLLMRGGDPRGARAALARGADIPGFLEPSAQAALLRQAAAIEHPNGPEARALLHDLSRGPDGRPGFASRTALALSSLGRTEAALDVATGETIDTEILFRPGQKAMLLSPRFPEVARRQGLWRYWETTGAWPDICRDPALPWRCAVTVKKASIPR